MAQSTITESAVSLNVNPSAPTGPVLKIVNGVPMVSSREVADHFGKRHADLIRSIAAIIRNAPESFNERNFALVEYIDPKGEKRPAYEMTRDGFVIVAMGFTGKKAIEWKITYIMAFNAMEAQGMSPLTGPISLAQQQEIRELIQAKVSAYPKDQHRKVYGQVYTRLAIKFKVPRYQELPVSIFHDARDYVISMDVRSVDAPALPAAEPIAALPPATAPRRVTFEDYQKLYPGLVCGPQHWELLRDRIYTAMDVFMTELKAVQKEAINPFQINRKSNIQNYLDAAMGPMHSLWDSSTENMRMSYKNAYDALDGCRDTWMLLHKG